MSQEILVVNKKGGELKFKITSKTKNSWCPNNYVKVIKNNDPNNLAFLLYDLDKMGFPVLKAINKFKEFNEEEAQKLKERQLLSRAEELRNEAKRSSLVQDMRSKRALLARERRARSLYGRVSRE